MWRTQRTHHRTDKPSDGDGRRLDGATAADIEGKLKTVREVKRPRRPSALPVDTKPANISALNQSLFGLYGYLGLIAQR
jgi:hypothetical protein